MQGANGDTRRAEWWNEFNHRTVEKDVLVVFNQGVWDLVKCWVVARDVLVGFFGAVRAVVIVDEVEVQREVSESRSKNGEYLEWGLMSTVNVSIVL